MNMLLRQGAKEGEKLGISLPETVAGLPRYPSNAKMEYDPVHHDGITDRQWRAQERATRRYQPKRKIFANLGKNAVADDVQYHENNRAGRARKIQKAIAIAALITTPFIVNRASGLLLWSGTHPEFHKIASSQNTHNQCVVFEMSGFGTHNSDDAARRLAPTTTREGDVYSLQYDNSHFNASTDPTKAGTVNTTEIADTAEQIVRDNHYTCISAIGHSFGGLVAADIMAQLEERLPEADEEYLILDGTPVTGETVVDSELQRGYWLNTALTNPALTWLNGPGARGMIELSQRIDSTYSCDLNVPECYINWNGVMWAVNQARDRMSASGPSNELLGAQFQSVVLANIRTSLEKLSHADKRRQPVIVYMRPDDPTRDHTVKTELSEAQLQNFCNELGFRLVVITLPKPAVHADPVGAPELYKQGLDELFTTVPPHVSIYDYNEYDGTRNRPVGTYVPPIMIRIPEPTN